MRNVQSELNIYECRREVKGLGLTIDSKGIVRVCKWTGGELSVSVNGRDGELSVSVNGREVNCQCL